MIGAWTPAGGGWGEPVGWLVVGLLALYALARAIRNRDHEGR